MMRWIAALALTIAAGGYTQETNQVIVDPSLATQVQNTKSVVLTELGGSKKITLTPCTACDSYLKSGPVTFEERETQSSISISSSNQFVTIQYSPGPLPPLWIEATSGQLFSYFGITTPTPEISGNPKFLGYWAQANLLEWKLDSAYQDFFSSGSRVYLFSSQANSYQAYVVNLQGQLQLVASSAIPPGNYLVSSQSTRPSAAIDPAKYFPVVLAGGGASGSTGTAPPSLAASAWAGYSSASTGLSIGGVPVTISSNQLTPASPSQMLNLWKGLNQGLQISVGSASMKAPVTVASSTSTFAAITVEAPTVKYSGNLTSGTAYLYGGAAGSTAAQSATVAASQISPGSWAGLQMILSATSASPLAISTTQTSSGTLSAPSLWVYESSGLANPTTVSVAVPAGVTGTYVDANGQLPVANGAIAMPYPNWLKGPSSAALFSQKNSTSGGEVLAFQTPTPSNVVGAFVAKGNVNLTTTASSLPAGSLTLSNQQGKKVTLTGSGTQWTLSSADWDTVSDNPVGWSSSASGATFAFTALASLQPPSQPWGSFGLSYTWALDSAYSSALSPGTVYLYTPGSSSSSPTAIGSLSNGQLIATTAISAGNYLISAQSTRPSAAIDPAKYFPVVLAGGGASGSTGTAPPSLAASAWVGYSSASTGLSIGGVPVTISSNQLTPASPSQILTLWKGLNQGLQISVGSASLNAPVTVASSTSTFATITVEAPTVKYSGNLTSGTAYLYGGAAGSTAAQSATVAASQITPGSWAGLEMILSATTASPLAISTTQTSSGTLSAPSLWVYGSSGLANPTTVSVAVPAGVTGTYMDSTGKLTSITVTNGALPLPYDSWQALKANGIGLIFPQASSTVGADVLAFTAATPSNVVGSFGAASQSVELTTSSSISGDSLTLSNQGRTVTLKGSGTQWTLSSTDWDTVSANPAGWTSSSPAGAVTFAAGQPSLLTQPWGSFTLAVAPPPPPSSCTGVTLSIADVCTDMNYDNLDGFCVEGRFGGSPDLLDLLDPYLGDGYKIYVWSALGGVRSYSGSLLKGDGHQICVDDSSFPTTSLLQRIGLVNSSQNILLAFTGAAPGQSLPPATAYWSGFLQQTDGKAPTCGTFPDSNINFLWGSLNWTGSEVASQSYLWMKPELLQTALSNPSSVNTSCPSSPFVSIQNLGSLTQPATLSGASPGVTPFVVNLTWPSDLGTPPQGWQLSVQSLTTSSGLVQAQSFSSSTLIFEGQQIAQMQAIPQGSVQITAVSPTGTNQWEYIGTWDGKANVTSLTSSLVSVQIQGPGQNLSYAQGFLNTVWAPAGTSFAENNILTGSSLSGSPGGSSTSVAGSIAFSPGDWGKWKRLQASTGLGPYFFANGTGYGVPLVAKGNSPNPNEMSLELAPIDIQLRDFTGKWAVQSGDTITVTQNGNSWTGTVIPTSNGLGLQVRGFPYTFFGVAPGTSNPVTYQTSTGVSGQASWSGIGYPNVDQNASIPTDQSWPWGTLQPFGN